MCACVSVCVCVSVGVKMGSPTAQGERETKDVLGLLTLPPECWNEWQAPGQLSCLVVQGRECCPELHARTHPRTLSSTPPTSYSPSPTAWLDVSSGISFWNSTGICRACGISSLPNTTVSTPQPWGHRIPEEFTLPKSSLLSTTLNKVVLWENKMNLSFLRNHCV